jgi:hypothetical protein
VVFSSAFLGVHLGNMMPEKESLPNKKSRNTLIINGFAFSRVALTLGALRRNPEGLDMMWRSSREVDP